MKKKDEQKSKAWYFTLAGGVYAFGPIRRGYEMTKKEARIELLKTYSKKELREMWVAQ